jgi:single-strand DNA-binding protein
MTDYRLPSLNKVYIVGNLTKDPELKNTNNGTPVVNFRIASDRRFKNNMGEWKEEVCYVSVVAWHKVAESCGKYLKKGEAVLVEGELQSRSWETDKGEKRSVLEIRAYRVQFLNRKKSAEGEEVIIDEVSEDVPEEQN